MKKLNLVIFLLFTIPGISQVKDSSSLVQPKTEIGKFDVKIGTIIKKEFVNLYTYEPKGFISKFSPMKAEALNITDAASGIMISGLRISNSYAAFVDVDEIHGLLKFIEFLEKNESEKPENYTEYEYNFKDFEVAAYYSNDLFKKNPPIWHYIIKTSFYSASRSEVELKTLTELKDAILKSKDKFKQAIPNY